jgi:hypothetical protein
MVAWRILGSLTCLLAATSTLPAQTYPLGETSQPGDCFRLRLDMKLAGEMKVRRGDETVPLTLEATATHEFAERALAIGAGGLPEKVARQYGDAKAVIGVGGAKSERTLRADRRLCVTQRYKDQYLVYCPTAALTREELDLVSDHFDTLFVGGLLPGKAVAVGDSWKLANHVAQALAGFEALVEHDLIAKLDTVKDKTATFSVSGCAKGVDHGASVKVTVNATGTFDLDAKRLVSLKWTQKDERELGPVSPAATVETTTTLTRKPIEQPENLADVKLVSVPDSFTVPATLLQLEMRDPDGRFELFHARDWQIVGQSKDRTVLRLMERGDFVAQVTITPWKSADKGSHTAPDDFKMAMNNAPGWEAEQELQAGEMPPDKERPGRWVYRLSLGGKMDGLPVIQNFYLIAGPGGEQVVVVFTMTPKMAEKFGVRDLTFAAGVDVPATKKKD